MSADRERALRLGMDRTRREMLAGQDDALARVEVERRLELEARRGLGQAVVEARAEGSSWERIAHHVPRLGPAGAEAAEKLFASVSVPGSRLGEDHVTWRCGDCDGLVLDRGPDAGHPVDAEAGHREDCRRLAAEVSRYVAGLDADDQLAAGIARVVTDHVRELAAWDRPVELDDPGLQLW
ncbi:MAG: hypothetical protein ACRDZW_09210 [Acidimicrobiales bacterium]